jgi:hypothetical protein
MGDFCHLWLPEGIVQEFIENPRMRFICSFIYHMQIVDDCGLYYLQFLFFGWPAWRAVLSYFWWQIVIDFQDFKCLPQTLPCYSNHLWKLPLYYTTNVGKTISYTTHLGMVYTIYLWWFGGWSIIVLTTWMISSNRWLASPSQTSFLFFRYFSSLNRWLNLQVSKSFPSHPLIESR